MPHQAIQGVTNEMHTTILMDRARKHRALLHNQPYESPIVVAGSRTDARIDESELILFKLLVQFGLISPEEQIEEIGDVSAEEAALNATSPYLSISTDRQVIEIPYN